ncbi:FkbM family methyltransferase [Candidatus Pelagibacter sp.]|uniref:FkbM family methyltransferase n=1 Tax=Candidatus Pelagibacter sp. TaxID=2024849 RepID=UPI003F849F8B
MIKKIAKLFIFILNILDFFLKKIRKSSILYAMYEQLRENKIKVKIDNNEIFFQSPNSQIDFRVKSIFTKEPETINWINEFDGKDLIFWDIGSNIGLFSIYAGVKHENINVFSFEPSTKNLNILSNNISKNNLTEKIKIIQLPLTENKNQILKMSEKNFFEGAASNNFGVDYSFGGKKINFENQYYIYGTSIDNLINEKILEIPNYIKIDVDGIEHLILRGAKKTLQNPKIKSILIEVQEDFVEQFENIKKILKENNFHLISKNQSERYINHPKFKNSYNYIYKK